MSANARTAFLAQFRADVVAGLTAPQKYLPSKYFYDEAGSALFEQLTTLDEYYPTRTELAIMQTHAAEMARLFGPRCLLIEFGSGSSTKTRLLLDQLDDPAGYVPVDISGEQLERSAQALAAQYPHVEVMPLCADFTAMLALPQPRKKPKQRVVYFPGTTIGNMMPDEAIELLQRTAQLCAGGGLLLGADLRKDPAVMVAAYDDRQGVTAAFVRNLLVRVNREQGADFAVDQFEHRAVYNADEGRIEVYLVSRRDQSVNLANTHIPIAAGEPIRTQLSYKYRVEDLHELGKAAGFSPQQVWTDPAAYFSVHYFRCE